MEKEFLLSTVTVVFILINLFIDLIRANVGDRYVLEKMKELDVNIGGEQSGYIILSDFGTTGDGVLTSVKLVEAIRDSGKSLDELVGEIVDCHNY